jgi:thioredoxin reductase
LFDWIVIGGGIHGCTIASFLLKNGKATTEKLRIIDPYREPMARWKKNTAKIGMKFLRSPFVHHIDVNPLSLQQYSRKNVLFKNDFYGPYKRPSLQLFNEHCDDTLKDVNIKECWHQGYVTSIEKRDRVWKVSTAEGDVLEAQNIVLAISINEQLNIPEWAEEVKRELPNQVFHVFDEELEELSALNPPIAVIGGGITAAHLSMKLSSLFPGKVILVKRHPFRVHDFDSDPGWLGPKNLAGFHKTESYEERRNMIVQARNRGSLPKELYNKINKLAQEETLLMVDGEIVESLRSEDGTISLKAGEKEFHAGSIVLATGYLPQLPGGSWLRKLIETQGLSCARCGYPIVDQKLQWCPHLYVSGPLAELEIGPIARNISGARHAAERIADGLSPNY